jgi:cytochrome c oxidase subunit 1
VSTLLFLAPLWIGLFTYLVPLQIGARRLAFPRAQALALWSYVGGGALVLASYVVGRPNGAGISVSVPLAAPPGGASRATDLWIVGLGIVTLSAIVAAANIFTTVLRLRAEGMTLGRIPPFSWAAFAHSGATLLAGPIFAAGLLLLYLDEHNGGSVFAARQVNGNLVWQHLVWLYGRPDVYLLFLPVLGVASDVLMTHGRRPLFMSTVVRGAIAAFAVLSFGVLTASAPAERAVLLPTPTVVSAFVVLPVGVCLLVWLRSIRPGQLRLHVSLLYVVGAILLVLLGGAAAIGAAADGLGANSAWTTGQLHAVLVGAPTLAGFAAFYHWAPKLWGRTLNPVVGVLQWLLVFGGFVLSAAGNWFLGFAGAPWHVADLTGPGSKGSWLALARLSGAGEVLIVLGFLVLVANLLASIMGPGGPAPDDPYQGLTLEWATSSPPPADNFAYVPEVRSETPLADLRGAPAGES